MRFPTYLFGLLSAAAINAPPLGDAADGPSPEDITLSCDRVVYSDGDAISVTLIFKKGAPSDKRLSVFLATTKANDIEIIGLEQDSARPGTYRAESPVPIKGGPRGQRFDQILVAKSGETICALYYPSEEIIKSWPKDAAAVGDVAIMADPEFKGPEIKVDSRLLPTKRKLKPDANAPLVGTLVQNGVIGEIVANELIFMPRRGEELQDILARTGGKIVGSSGKKQDRGGVETSYLIRVDPARGNTKHLGQIRDFAGEKSPMTVSRTEVLGVYALGMELALEGYRVAINPVLLSMVAPTTPEETSRMLGQNVLNDGSTGPDATREPRFFDVPILWSFLALWEIVGEQNEPRIPVAFLDTGFAPNEDFRHPGDDEPFVECRIRAHPLSDEVQCGEGVAEGLGPGGSDWHGNGAVSSASARVNNGFGTGGTGGQVVVPRLYAFDRISYWQCAAGIKRAASDGASLISLSSGYSCALATTLGPDSFDLCNPTGRTLLCAAVTAALVAANTAVCTVATFEWISPLGFVTGFNITKACLATSLATVVTAGFCVAQFISGDWRAPIQEAVDQALGLGVPIVASAGNDPRVMVQNVVGAGLLPEVIGTLVDLENRQIEAWQVLPAMLPGVICVGEASSSKSSHLRNVGLFGPRIDIWAPTGSIYFRPPPGTDDLSSNQQTDRGFDGTSDAAPYISGLVADAIAINPALNPNTPGLNDEQRQNIPGNIRELLVQTAFTAEALAVLELGDNGERRNLVNGFEFLLNVARNRPENPIPDIVGLGYELSANVKERQKDNDTPENATDVLGMNPHYEETISFLPGDGGADDISDVDFLQLENLSVPAPQFRQVTLTYPQPESFGELQLTGRAWSRVSRTRLDTGEVADTYRAIFLEPPRDEQLIIEISGVGPDTDNVYKIGVKPPEPFTPFDPDRFDIEDVVVNNTPPNGVLVGGGTATGSWRPVVDCGLGLELKDLNIHDPDDLDWFTLKKLPPIRGGKCPSVLLVEFGHGMRLTVYTPSGEVLLTTVQSPARIPESLIALPLRLKLEAASAGTAVNYKLNFCYSRPPDSECASTPAVAGYEPGPVADLPGTGTMTYPQFFPEAATGVRDARPIDALPGATELPPLERSRKRPRDQKGLLTATDRYSVKWNGGGPFRLRAAVGRGESLKVRLLDARGNVMQQRSVGLGTNPEKGDDTGLKGRKQRNEVALRVPNLSPGTYFVEFSHARMGTQIDFWAPRARK